MKFNVNITYDILWRTAYVHPAFTSTYSALPYAIRPLLPDLRCYREYAGFCDHNGYEKGFKLTSDMTEFYDEFLGTPPQYRRDLDTRSFILDLPDSITSYLGAWWIKGVLSSTSHIKIAR